MEAALMGRPKKKREPGGGDPPRVRHVAIRANDAWAAWLERAAAHCRTDVSKLFDMAVTKFAREQGFDEPPPPRY